MSDHVLILHPAMSCALQYGKVYKGLWRGTVVAVKSMMLPFGMTGVDKHERCVQQHAGAREWGLPSQQLMWAEDTTCTGAHTLVFHKMSATGNNPARAVQTASLKRLAHEHAPLL